MKHIFLTGLLLSILALAVPNDVRLHLFFKSSAVERMAENQSKTEVMTTISFCEIVKNPRLYFDKVVRLNASWQQGYEGSWLVDYDCAEKVRVGFKQVPREQWCDAPGKSFDELRERKYGGRADLVLIGKLENKRRTRSFFNYDYLFVASCIEKVSEAILKYDGFLNEGETYRADFKCDKVHGWQPIIPPKIAMHQAYRFEWMNADKHAEMKIPAAGECRRRIVFRVSSIETRQVTENRWNKTFHCEIISVE